MARIDLVNQFAQCSGQFRSFEKIHFRRIDDASQIAQDVIVRAGLELPLCSIGNIVPVAHRLLRAFRADRANSSRLRAKKRQKFVQFAEGRTVNAIRAIRVIGKLGNRSHHQYDDADVKKIVSALTKEIDVLKARMTEQGSRVAVEFKL